jgi:molybdopterin-containing oxidoreductase family molybdopterin binding subunit
LPQWVYGKDRISQPMRRVGARGEGQFEPISWDEALDEVAGRLGGLVEAHGASSVAFTRTSGSSQLGNYSRLAALLGGGGTANFYGGVDMAVHMGLNNAFGFKGMFGQHANEWTDRRRSKLIIVWGHNPAETAMTSMKHLLDARDEGSRLVVIDPRYSATAMHANWWLAPRPGSDLPLALGLLHVLVAEDLIDRPFALANSCAPLLVRLDDGRYLRQSDVVSGGSADAFMVWDEDRRAAMLAADAGSPALAGRFDIAGLKVATAFTLLCDLVGEFPPERAAALTGLAAGDIVDLARAYAAEKPAMIGFGYGVDRYRHGELLTRAAAAMALLTGNIGIPGAGVGVQSHGYGFREVRFGASDRLPDWAITESIPNIEVGKRALPVRALFCQGDWLNQRMPDMNAALDYLKTLEFVVTVDHFWQTTTQWSDIVLPASTFLEATSTVRDAVLVGNSVLLRQKVIDPVGLSRPDADIERDLAQRLGLGAWFEETPEHVVRRQIDGSPDPALAGVTFDQLVASGGGVRLNVPSTPNVQYADLSFGTKSGRGEFYTEELAGLGEALPVFREDHEALDSHPLARRFPLVLVQTHVRQRAHSTFFNTGWTLEIWPEPVLEMNPDDAARRGLGDGDLGEAYNQRGRVVARVVCNPDFPPGMCNVSEGWKQHQYVSGNVQQLTNGEINPAHTLLWGHANIPFFDTRVEVKRFSEAGA